jgi:hypothetical protein
VRRRACDSAGPAALACLPAILPASDPAWPTGSRPGGSLSAAVAARAPGKKTVT